jgi:hypothetical protein
VNDDDLDHRLRAYGQRWRDDHPFANDVNTLPLTDRPRRRRLVAIAAAVLAVAVGIGVAVAVGHSGAPSANRVAAPPSSSFAASPTTTTLPSTAPLVVGSTDLPVVGCPTNMAISPLPVHPIAPPNGLPANMHDRLAIYSDVTGVLVVVAPRDWSCIALLAADGSGSIAVYPPDGPPPDAYGEPPHIAQGITARTEGGCAGCTAIAVCTLLPDTPFVQATTTDTCKTSPAHETVTSLGANTVAFEDPAGYAGNGNPSGGPYTANGVAILQQAGDLFEDWITTCTLPDDQHDVCTAVLNEFLTQHPPAP